MKFIIFANFLFAISLLASGVSGWYYDKSVKTIQRCTTEYCNKNVHPPKTSIKTVHKTSKVTVTVTPKPTTRYVIKPHQTKTITQKTTKTYIITAKCSTRTIYTTRFTTVTRTIPRLTTVTTSITVETITPPATFLPIPSGFLSAGDDPDNQYTRPGEGDIEKRHAKSPYPTSVKCTKTIQTIYKHTVTAKRRTTTVTNCGKTVIIRQTTKIYKTKYQQKPKTTTITRVATRTSTKTKTSTKTVTKRITATLPGFTTIGACGPNNHFMGPSGGVDVVIRPGDIIVPAENSYECCAQCHTHVNGAGVPDCAGGYMLGNWRTNEKTCWLRLTDVCSYDHHERFTPKPWTDEASPWQGAVSNGPCGRWKVQL